MPNTIFNTPNEVAEFFADQGNLARTYNEWKANTINIYGQAGEGKEFLNFRTYSDHAYPGITHVCDLYEGDGEIVTVALWKDREQVGIIL